MSPVLCSFPLSFWPLGKSKLCSFQRKWDALHPELSKAAITFSFVLAASICACLSLLTLWNLYLIASAQTTVEFYENRAAPQEMRTKGIVFVNEYDLGTVANLKNFFNIGN